ncbi:hypothetical protein DXG01_007119 [Tephrocybe rancida]|nr:hypothetical protein DXG01_007119 [Tephrocybe rancida]
MELSGHPIAPTSTVNSISTMRHRVLARKKSVYDVVFMACLVTVLPASVCDLLCQVIDRVTCFTNEGLVTSTSSSNNYNAIDPNLLIDGSNWYLSLGSFWTGIKLETLGSSTGKPTSTAVTALAQRTANGGAIEASVIYKNGSFYYLFSSWDNCCQGTSSTYNIRVGRSTSATGGYVDQAGVALTSGGGTLVLGTHDSRTNVDFTMQIIGPGGQDVMTDGDGPILVYHYYTSAGSFLGINRLDFSSGWPFFASTIKRRPRSCHINEFFSLHGRYRLLGRWAISRHHIDALLDTAHHRNAEMGFFSSKKADDTENHSSKENNEKSVASVIRSRFYGKNKGRQRDGHSAPTFTIQSASVAQTLSNSTTTPPSSAPIRQPSPLSRNSNAARTAGPSILRAQTEGKPSTSAFARKATSTMSNMEPPPSPSGSTATDFTKQSSKIAPHSPRQPSDNVTYVVVQIGVGKTFILKLKIRMTLAQRLNELAAANSQGLLNDDEYRLLRQNLFERFATSVTVPTEAPVVPVSRAQPRVTAPQEGKPRPLSNFQVEVNRSPSIRSKSSVTSGVAKFLRRATSRRTPAGSNDFSDTSSVFSSASLSSNIFKRGVSKKSSASSVRTTTSRAQVDTISISSRTGMGGSQTDHPHLPSHPSISISRSNASIRRLATPPSAFPSRLPGSETQRTSAFNADLLDGEHIQTTAEIRQEISTVEAEARRLMDAFNGLEMTTLAKLQRHQGRSTLTESAVSPGSISMPSTPRRVTIVADSDMTSLRSAASAASMARSAHSRARSKGGLGTSGTPHSARSGSLRRQNSTSSVGTEEGRIAGRGNLPPVPALPASYGHLGVGSVSNVSLARSHITMSVVPEDEQPSAQEERIEDEMEDIQRRREDVNERYAARLEYLRAKLKGAQLREKLARK